MSKVTINTLFSAKWCEQDEAAWKEVVHTSIVPRKMVVMIMEKCMKDYDVYGKESFAGREALSIAEYAHELLKKFEGDIDET
jgi:hypothetical protein